jgi:hypothetical protein
VTDKELYEELSTLVEALPEVYRERFANLLTTLTISGPYDRAVGVRGVVRRWKKDAGY